MQAKFIHFDKVDSTNNMAFSLIEKGEGEGCIVVADSQTKGRGRGNNVWASPEKAGIYASFILKPSFKKHFHLLGLVLGLAVVRTLKLKAAAGAVLKWPNDILLNSKKIGGILSESRQYGEDVFLVLGLGVNVNTRPADLPPNASSLYIETGKEFDILELLENIAGQFFALYEKIPGGINDIIKEIEINMGTLGQHIEVEYKGVNITGHALAVNEEGGLILRRENGEILPLSVSFVRHLR